MLWSKQSRLPRISKHFGKCVLLCDKFPIVYFTNFHIFKSLFQRFIPLAHMESLLQALGKCSLLTRVGLVSPRAIWGQKKQTISNHFRSLCENCPNLVALFGHLTAPNNIFEGITASLNERFRESRPSFRADIYSIHNRLMQECYRSDKLPLMHSGSLTSINSNVALLPYNCDSYLHRV